ncbi:MAG: hypothetical protein OXG78_12545 [Chloroflexi bacterium]|nr:hypothetical protein [Chloroflexota bacterium]
MRVKLRQHLHFFIVITVLTVLMTWPTIVYAFRTDVNWLPEATHPDVYLELWKNWYGGKVLIGQADRFHTDLIFYPDGVPLSYTQLNFPYIAMSNALLPFMTAFNAYSISYLLITVTAALAAYAYLLWLFKDKRLALFGAVLFAFCPQIVGLPVRPGIAFLAPTPLVLYWVHRGLTERRASLIILGGAVAGLTTAVVMYQFVCVLIALGLLVCGLAVSRWRNMVFWRQVVLLVSAIAISCAWRVIPMLQDQGQLDRAIDFASDSSQSGDLISFFINRKNPILGPFAESLVDQMPGNSKPLKRSYLGFVPLMLVGIGLLNKHTRRRMLPWLGLLLVFLVLSLGSVLKINGIVYEDILLPKHYLDQLLPVAFAAFRHPDHLSFFLIGAWLPLAILACFGLMALRERFPFAAGHVFILLLISISALERYIPVYHPPKPWWVESVSEERLAYLNWLKQEEEENIALVNVPFGWTSEAFYVYAQTLSGFPISAGATNRTLASAYNYIKANYILNAWYSLRPIRCEAADPESYLSAVAALEADGFSHIVFHRAFPGHAQIGESFDGIPAAYSDGYVSIYRLSELSDSCPKELSAQHHFADAYGEALGKGAILDERHGVAVVLPPTAQIAEHFMRYLRHAGWRDPTIAAISSDEQGKVEVLSTETVDLDQENAIWLFKDRLEFDPERAAPNHDWLLARFRSCERFYEDEGTTIDLYLKLDIPCAAMDESGAIGVRYDDGVRLHNAYYEVASDEVRFYLAWTSDTEKRYAFSLQFFDSGNHKALQYDHPIWRELLGVHEIDTTPLPAGAYTVKLIVYDFETQISQGGTLTDTGERFERELILATLEL